MHFMGKLGLKKVSARPWPLKIHFLTFTLSVNKIIIYQFSMFKSLDSIASVVGIFMYLTISKFKQVPRSRKGLDYNTETQLISLLHLCYSSTVHCVQFSDYRESFKNAWKTYMWPRCDRKQKLLSKSVFIFTRRAKTLDARMKVSRYIPFLCSPFFSYNIMSSLYFWCFFRTLSLSSRWQLLSLSLSSGATRASFVWSNTENEIQSIQCNISTLQHTK